MVSPVAPAALARTLLVALFAALLAFAPPQARAQQLVTVTTTVTTTVTWIDDNASDAGNAGAQFADDADEFAADDDTAALLGDTAVAGEADLGATRRYAPGAGLATRGPTQARFGPFAVVNGTTARMSGDVDGATPRQFAAMLAAFPGVRRLEMIDCPGSLDEEANLILARAIRRAGLETVVPSGGSVRSGAVELWLAGSTRRAAPDAEFGVHSWADEYGREAKDYPASDPVHAEYIGLYREMGMDDAHARAFYALTNATPFDQVRYLTRDDMARFVPLN
ncbi:MULTISPECIES: alpha/beta hydrolase [Sphingopyxis]|uniref:alpha/beta hydrolase n=1 Tax=Sphingopyxis TaxID=165697 RepID=UPI001644C76D|nr:MULTISPECIES: alpha/beta hydrolase [Sphingopyxis]QXF10836.1 alpha/beta hydrolase [Sphingopyxis terrae subsp. terrae]